MGLSAPGHASFVPITKGHLIVMGRISCNAKHPMRRGMGDEREGRDPLRVL